MKKKKKKKKVDILIIKFLGSDFSGYSLSKDFRRGSDALRHLGSPSQQKWDINQGISERRN